MSCFYVCVKEYITVSQLSQIFGMQRVNPSSSSSSMPAFQLASSESTFSCHTTARGPSSFLSAQVCSFAAIHRIAVIFVSVLAWYYHKDFSTCLMLLLMMLLLCCSLFPLPERFTSPQSQPELSRNALPPLNLERWYQEIMAAGEPQPCPPPLPAKSFATRRHGQVNSLKLSGHLLESC